MNQPFSSNDSLASTRVSEDELTAMALAANPDAPLDDNAVPWNLYLGRAGNLLPDWYMARPSAVNRSTGSKIVVYGVVIGMVVICAFGLCVTSGFVSIA